MTDYSYNFFANRATQSLAQDTYYHTFYQVSQENPNIMTTYTYDNNKNLIETFDVSFGAFSVSEALQILDQNGTNPYVVGTNSTGTEFRPMGVGYFDIYNRFLTTSQHKGVMTKVNKTDLMQPPNLIGSITGSNIYKFDSFTTNNGTEGVEIQIFKDTFPVFFAVYTHDGKYINTTTVYVVNIVVTHPTNSNGTHNFTAVVQYWTNGQPDGNPIHFLRCNNCSTTDPQGDSTSTVYFYDATPP
jgi:hypothetical protein